MPSPMRTPKGLEPYYEPATFGAVQEWRKFATALDLGKLADLATSPPEISDDGNIYEVETPDNLPGDFVIVDMRKVKVDTPHSHINGEIEAHIPLAGTARISLGDLVVVNLVPGNTMPVIPGEPHFVIPDDEYIAGVLSLPNYSPDNQIPVDLTQRYTENFNSRLYEAAQGNSQ